ncbi:hypothetical protein BD289DRAFT_189620 [Coniella lustricola]|uniref:Uncharacterized protein n=1 Tax=Coniella lustricola TaxID=2025994 RepID=A0A2T3AD10_9PEZI|nr:hypothetical protein BD289DRAFT_189620 [Coniella lustricola]
MGGWEVGIRQLVMLFGQKTSTLGWWQVGRVGGWEGQQVGDPLGQWPPSLLLPFCHCGKGPSVKVGTLRPHGSPASSASSASVASQPSRPRYLLRQRE